MHFENPKPPPVINQTPCTKASIAFHSDWVFKLKLLQFLGEVTLHKDETEMARQNRHLPPGEDGPLGQELHASSPLICEMVLCRTIDNFSLYVTDLLREIHRMVPEALRSSEQITVSEVLEHESIRGLLDWLIERRVERLAYKGMRELSSEIEKRLGFRLFEQDEDLETAVLAVELRNAIVHNRGCVSEIGAKRASQLVGQVGKKIKLQILDLAGYLNFFVKQVQEIDERAAQKFGLQKFVQRLSDGDLKSVHLWPETLSPPQSESAAASI
jgi:hypothetical protein